ncbi:MAG: hypothetical protein PVI03_03925, partial [Candidatus Thorarchaeota archaeon]
ILAKELLDNTERLYRKLNKSILLGEINIESIRPVLAKYGLTEGEFGNQWLKTMSTSGKNLATMSHLSRRLLKALDPDSVSHLRGMRGEFEKWIDKGDVSSLISHVTRHVENTRRALLVTQWKTAIRNWRTQSLRAVIGDVDELFQATLRGALNNTIYGGKKILGIPAKKPLSIYGELATVSSNISAGIRQLPFASKFGSKSQKELVRFLNSLEGQWAKARLNSATMLEVYRQGNKWDGVLDFANFWNRSQEMFFRRAAFEAKARQFLKREGKSFNAKNIALLGDDKIDEIINHTLEMTFAQSPKSSFAKGLVKHWSQNPLLTIINPFPRFHFANALPFFYEFSPIGWMKPDTVRHLIKGNVDELSKIGSRTAIGAGMWYSLWQLYQNFGSGERWFELNIPTDWMAALDKVQLADVNDWIEREDKAGNVRPNADGTSLVTDVRGDAPLTSGLFVMHGIDSILKGKDPFDRIPPRDLFQQLIGLNRVAGSGVEFFDLFRARNAEDVNRVFHNVAAQYLGSFSVPLKQFKDIATEIDPNVAIQRDVRQNGILSPFYNNISGPSMDLPPGYNPFNEGNIPEAKREGFTLDNIHDQLAYDASLERYFKGIFGEEGLGKPLFTQAMGLTLKHKQKIEREVDRLGIDKRGVYARSGDKRTDNLLNGYRGFYASRIIKPIITSPSYDRLGDATKKTILEELIKSGREFSASALASKHTGLFFKAYNKKQDEDILNLAKENGFDLETIMKDIEEKFMQEEPPQEYAPER